MKARLRRWAPSMGGVLVAALTLLMAGWDRSAPPLEETGFLLDAYVRVVAVDGDRPSGVRAALASLGAVERLLNRYDPLSDPARISRAAGEWVPVEPLTLRALLLARSWEARTGGAFDAALGGVIDLYRFGDGGQVPSPAELAGALALSGAVAWELDEAGSRARVARAGTVLDLGGLHKGLAVDQAAAALRAHGVTRGLVDAGGNMLALGLRADGSPWRIGIQHPRRPDRVLAVIPLSDQAIATSGDYQQFFEQGGKRYHHVLDPRTGEPASGVLSVTVLAPTAVEADLLSTALFVLGPERGMELVSRSPGVEALWVTGALELVATPGLRDRLEVRE
ncbi:MAG: FAD:protein FMN transferase [Bacillota bacterium]